MSGDVLAAVAAAWCALWSVVLFAMMGADKRRARRGLRRTPEKRLFAVAAIGGALGGLFGMSVFHHKTRHWYFRAGFAGLAAAQLAAIVCARRML